MYVAYKREGPKDYMDFKTELLNFAKAGNAEDIVVDVTKSGVFNEAEIGILAIVLRALRGTKRTLRLIMSRPIYKRLESTNLFKAENIAAYGNYKDFMLDINKSWKTLQGWTYEKLWNGVSREAFLEMEVGPLESLNMKRFQTTLSCYCQKQR